MYEVVISMALVTMVIAAGISISVYVGNTVSSLNDTSELASECSVLRQTTETWLSYYDNADYELSVKEGYTALVGNEGEVRVFNTLAASAISETDQSVYSVSFDKNSGTLTYAYDSGNVEMTMTHITDVGFSYIESVNIYVCEAYYGESCFRFTIMPRVRI